MKNSARKLDHNDNLIIAAYHIAETFGQVILFRFSNSFDKLLGQSFDEIMIWSKISDSVMKLDREEAETWQKWIQLKILQID